MNEDLLNIKNNILKLEYSNKNIQSEVKKIIKYAEIKELSRKIITSLIDSIFISEAQIIDGEKYFEIDINYKFQNNIVNKKDEKIKSLENKKIL